MAGKPEALAGGRKALSGDGLHAATAVFDVTDAAAVRRAIDGIEASYGHLDIVVNNAGIQRRKPLVEFTKQDWDDVIATNLTAPFLVSQAVLPGDDRAQGRQDHPHRLAHERARAADGRARTRRRRAACGN